MKPQQTWTAVDMHQRGAAPQVHKVGFKVIEEHRSVRPTEILGPLLQLPPLRFDIVACLENRGR